MFRVLDFLPVKYDQLGVVRSRQGNLNAYSAPSDVYKTQDDKWLALAVSAPTVFKRLTMAIGRPDLMEDPAFNTNAARIKNRVEIETIMKDWFADRKMIIPVEDEDFGSIKMQNVVPRFSKTPGAVWRTGPAIGQHNAEVYGDELGLSSEEQNFLRNRRII